MTITTLVAIVTILLTTVLNNKASSAYCIIIPPSPSKRFAAAVAAFTNRDRTVPRHDRSVGKHRPGIRCYASIDRESDDDGEDEAYLKALREAARDPVRFQEFIAKRQEMKQRQLQSSKDDDHDDDDHEESEPKKKGYVPIEQWEKERSENEESQSWEERVRFDGKRFGDGFNQNEILRKNLKSW